MKILQEDLTEGLLQYKILIMQHVICTFVIAQLTIMWKLRTSTDNMAVPYLVFHWAQYICSMMIFLFVQFCVNGLAQD